MLNAVIALKSDDLCCVLQERLGHVFSIRFCRDGKTALQLLHSVHPEVLILDLSLPELDGISLLEQCECKPPVILALTDLNNEYVRAAAQDIGIGYIIITPADVNNLVTRVLDMTYRHNKALRKHMSEGTQAAQILLELGFSMHLNGSKYLQAALPMYADEPSQQMKKELYEAIAALFHATDHRAVEHSIRKAIESAWLQREATAWEKYFPPGTITKEKGPSNKLFISRMAVELNRRK